MEVQHEEHVTGDLFTDASSDAEEYTPAHYKVLLAVRVCYILAALAFVVAGILLVSSFVQVQNLQQTEPTSLNVIMVSSVLIVKTIMSTFADWLLCTTIGFVSVVVGLFLQTCVK